MQAACAWTVCARWPPGRPSRRGRRKTPGATGSGAVLVDDDKGAQPLDIAAIFFGLSGTTTVARIHCFAAAPNTCTVGVAATPGTLPGFPVGVNFGVCQTTPDLTEDSTFNTGFIDNFRGGTVALLSGLDAGTGRGRAQRAVQALRPGRPAAEGPPRGAPTRGPRRACRWPSRS
jgi:hypothetical protein